MSTQRRVDAVLFDLLTALLDSWMLWNGVAGSAEDGHKWRIAYLRRTYEAGRYRPYETLLAEAAIDAGLSQELAGELAARYGELKPWPEVYEVLNALRRDGAALGVVMSCSEVLASKAVACTGVAFDVVVTAERAGYYKPHTRPYEMAARRTWCCAQPVPICGGLCLRPVWHKSARPRYLLARPYRHDAAAKRAAA